MDREKRFCELDTEIEKWSDDEKHFVLWQLLKDYANKLDIPENANTLEEHKLMTFNHNLWVDCSELIDILKQYDPEQEVVCFDEWGAEQELTESGVSATDEFSAFPNAIRIGVEEI